MTLPSDLVSIEMKITILRPLRHVYLTRQQCFLNCYICLYLVDSVTKIKHQMLLGIFCK